MSALSAQGCGEGAAESRGSFEAAITEKECEKRFRCELEDAADGIEREADEERNCRDVDGRDPEIEAFIAAGTVRYDAEAGRACLDSYDDLCISGHDEACGRVYVGTVEAGGACTSSIQCESSACTATGLACGMCRPVTTVGGACGGTGPVCPRGSFCDVLAASPVCKTTPVDTTFTRRQAAEGESCASTLTTFVECAPDLFCDSTQRCVARRALGAPCVLDVDMCAFGTVCLADGASTKCAPVETVDTLGESCGNLRTRFVLCDRDARLVCGDNGACVGIGGDGKEGSACEDDIDCRSGLCKPTGNERGTCVAGDREVGERCTDSSECRSRHCVLDTSGLSASCREFQTCQ